MAQVVGWFYYDPVKNSVSFIADNPNIQPIKAIDWSLLKDPAARQAFIDHFLPDWHKKEGHIRAFSIKWEETEIIEWLNQYETSN